MRNRNGRNIFERKTVPAYSGKGRPRATVPGREGGALLKAVNLDQCYSSSITLAADDGGIWAGIQRSHNGRLAIILRRYRGIDDLLLLGRAPIVVRYNRCAGAIVELEDGVLQSTGNNTVQGWSYRPYDYLGRLLLDDESADHHVVTAQHRASGGDLRELRLAR